MITIHVGLPKTGSSSIQLALRQTQLNPSHRLLIPREGNNNTENAWRKQISQLGASNTIIFSNEGVLGSPELGFPEIHGRLQQIKRATNSRPSQIVIYLRAHLDWLVSLYLQELQAGSTDSPEDFWSAVESSPFLYWSNLLNVLEEESGVDHVVIRAFEKGRDVVDDFFQILGLEYPRYLVPGMFRENTSIRPVQAPLLLALNRQQSHTRQESSPYRDIFQLVLSSGANPAGSPFPDSLQKHILEHYKSDWDDVTRMVTRRDPSEGLRFAHIGDTWFQGKKPFVGYDLRTKAVHDEALRTISQLANSWLTATPTIWGRLGHRIRFAPLSLPGALARRLSQGVLSASRTRKPRSLP